MRILSIETSCDETAISIIEGDGKDFKILGNALFSQALLHREYGGVYPTLAKREHIKNLPILLEQVLKEAGRQNEIDAIAVTVGPGLEPALWVGINFAQELAQKWDKPLIPVNHMEGHIFSSILQNTGEDEFSISNLKFPMLALLISGGHTQLVLSKEFLKYKIVGETLDDAVGEAFDKVARMMGLPYPGGPEISKLAEKSRRATSESEFKFPRPMIHSDTCDFSFSGLKTAVLYTLKKIPDLTQETKQKIAKEFEDVVIEVLLSKTKKALKEHDAKTLVIGGGVSANKRIKKAFEEMLKDEFPEIALYVPSPELSTDNAIMIAVAGYFRFIQSKKRSIELKANGNLSL